MERSERISRLVQWAEAQGAGGPDPTDVRIVAALGIEDLAAVDQMLWIGRDALKRNWNDLQRLLVAAPAAPYSPVLSQYPAPQTLAEPVAPTDTSAVPTYPTVYPGAIIQPAPIVPEQSEVRPTPTLAAPFPPVPAPPVSVPAPPVSVPAPPPPPPPVPAPPPEPAPTPALTGEMRHAQLLAWRSSVADNPEIAAISDEDLRRLAFSEAVTAKDVAQFALRTATRSVFTAFAPQLADALGSNASTHSDPDIATTQPELEADPAVGISITELEPTEDVWIHPSGHFAPFDWAGIAGEPPEVPAMLVVPSADGVRLTWQPVESPGKALYRVIEATDTWANVAPDTGITIGATWSHEVVAPITARGATTYLTVWVNQGENEITARHVQPQLVAKGEIVWPPQSLAVSVTPAGEVVARFTAPPAATVEVQKFLAGEPVRYDQTKSLRDGVSEDGFLDRQAQPGVDLTYAVYTVAVLTNGDKVVSEPLTATVKVIPEPHSISVNVVANPSAPRTYDISWEAPPFGSVEVFLTNQQPPSGLGDQSRTLEVIEMQGLTQDRQLKYPVHRAGTTHRMIGVTLDRGWVKGFFVAVHVVSSEAVRVGPTQSQVNAGPPKNLRIVERVDTQVITFEWPDDVRMVEVFQGPQSEPTLDPAQADVIATLTEDEYVERGGLRLKQPLPSNGCALYLFGVVYDLGSPTRSAPVRLEYSGINRLRYRVQPVRHDGAPVGQGSPPDVYRVLLQTDEPMPPTALCLVSNPARLPLHPQDTDQGALQVMTWSEVSPPPGAPVMLCEIPRGSRPLYVRLFVNFPPALCGSVAVLDPPLGQLKVLA